jgi:hypothetical protein
MGTSSEVHIITPDTGKSSAKNRSLVLVYIEGVVSPGSRPARPPNNAGAMKMKMIRHAILTKYEGFADAPALSTSCLAGKVRNS